MQDFSVIASRLRQARKEKGLSQEKLGVLAGIDEFSASARVNQYERGKHAPDYQTMLRFAAVLTVPVAFFYTPDDTEAALLVTFANLSESQRKAVLALAEQLSAKGPP